MSKIYLFRHAQASIGKANYDVLSTKGEKQAGELGKSTSPHMSPAKY